jgi:type I restriction enzyme M protein
MTAGLDPYKRFDWAMPPISSGDYAFVMHMRNCLDDSTGRMGIVLPHGVLFRGAQEGIIRKTIIENFNLLDAVIGLPENLFFGAGITDFILIFKKNRKTRNVFFIEASGVDNYEKSKTKTYCVRRIEKTS